MPGAVPASPSEIAPAGQRRLLAHARLEVRVRPVEPLGDRAARPPRSRSCSAVVDDELAARPPARRSSTVRSSCVGPSPPETRQRSACEPLRERRLELVGPVADDRDPRRLEAERERLRGEERAVQVGALAADELAAR